MACRDFTVNDVITLCSDIAENEGIMLQIPEKKKDKLWRTLSGDLSEILSSKTAKLNVTGTSGSKSACSSPVMPRGRTFGFPNASKAKKQDTKTIPGLQGRDIMTITIVVNDSGAPVKTYTEDENIPIEEYDTAKNVFVSRVPMSYKGPTTSSNNNLDLQTFDETEQLNVKLLSHFLQEDIDVEKAKKLKKRMSKVLIKLHTTDLSTAKAFLNAKRFANVRSEIKAELLTFVDKDLKMTRVDS